MSLTQTRNNNKNPSVEKSNTLRNKTIPRPKVPPTVLDKPAPVLFKIN